MVTSLSFNHNDTGFAITADGFLQKYDLINLKFKSEDTIDRTREFKSGIFLNDSKDDFKLITVGSELTKNAFCRVYNQNDNVEF